MDVRSRAWCFTLNNYTVEQYDSVVELQHIASYVVIGEEVGASGTPHIQGYVYFKNAKSFKKMQKLIPEAHLEVAKGTPQEASDYCKKDGQYEEHGVLPKQGKRVDLDLIKNEIVNGKKVDDIVIESPAIYHQYGRTLEKIEDIVLRKQTRTQMTKGFWIYGTSGCGKSEMLFKKYNNSDYYVWKKDKEWQCGYKQQNVVIIDEFRGQLPFYKLLELCDRWTNCWLERRGREAIPFVSKCVCITSPLKPEEVYKNLDANDKWIQFNRRYRVIDISDIRQKLILELELKFLE